jgi:hypothetical protein
MKDNSNGVTLSRSKAAHSMSKVDAVGSPRSLNWPMMHGERHRVALAERDHFWPRLHTWPLLGEHEFAAGEIPLRFRQQDGHLYRESVLSVEVLMQAVEVARAVLKEQWRGSLLSCVVASLNKLVMTVRIANVHCHSRVPAIRDGREPRVESCTETLDELR